jgi:hypothetical protein
MTLPGPDDVFHELAGLGATLWRILEITADHARQYYDSQGLDVEPCLFANLTRYQALIRLKAEGYELGELINNGIQVEYREYSIKVLKSDDGGLPVPGPSHTKQCFYQQVLPFKGNVDVILPPDQHRNLIVCWDVDNDYMISRLTLYSPQSGDESTARARWSRAIPHPGESGIREAIDISTAQAVLEDDLDITPRDEGSAQTGTNEDD